MATNRLQVRLDAVDNTKRAFGSLRSSIINLKSILATVGVGVFAKSIVDTGRQVEGLATRFKFLFGSAAEGSKAFDTLTNFASKVPFSLEEISAASGNLAVVSKDADELSKVLKITGNVAAVTGLDFQTTASQIQRSFAGGIAAADVFREKGVRSLLGFKAGATVTAEETIKRFEEVFGEGGRFGQATDELAQTFDGTLSMLGDKLFKFKKDTAEAQFFNALKVELEDLNNFIEANEQVIKEFTINIGNFLASAVRALSDAVKFVRDNLDNFILGLKILIGLKVASVVLKIAAAFKSLTIAIKAATLATIGFNKVVRRNLIIAGIAIAVANIDKIIKKLKEYARTLGLIKQEEDNTFDEGDSISATGAEVEKVNEKLSTMEKILGKVKEAYDEVFGTSPKKALDEFGKAVKKSFEGISKSIGDAVAQTIVFGKTFGDVLKAALRNVLAQFISQLVQIGIKLILNTKLAKQFGDAMKSIITGGGSKSGFNLDSIVSGFLPKFAEGGRIKAGQPAIVGERGRELFIPSTDGQIVSNENMGRGTTNINFTIVANDTKDFDNLLIERRSVITNLVNQALNQQGRKALV